MYNKIQRQQKQHQIRDKLRNRTSNNITNIKTTTITAPKKKQIEEWIYQMLMYRKNDHTNIT